MLALLYLALAIYLGDQLCRRCFRFISVAQRLASAVIVGVLVSSWFTYLASWMFRATARPVLWGDLCFFAVAIGTFVIFHPAAWAFIGFIVLVGPPCDWLLGGSGRL